MPQKSKANKRKKVIKNAIDDELKSTSFGNLANVENLEYTDVIELEDIPRRFEDNDEVEEGLPIIVNGKVKRVKRRKVESVSEDEQVQDDETDDKPVTNAAEPEYMEMDANELKERIALYAELITAEPENNMSKLSEIIEHAEKTKKSRSRQLLLLSLTTIFKGIIPGYKIKELTETQKREKVSKEVRNLRDFEQSLLSSYKRFVHLIHHSFKASKGENVKHGKYVLGCTAIEVACDLVEALPHFNFCHELVVTIVEKMSSQKLDQAFNRCIACLKILFEQDEEGNISFQAVQALYRMIKSRRYKVNSQIISVFLHLRLLSELQGRADLEKLIKVKPQSIEGQLRLKKRDRIHLTKAQRKARKEQKEVDEEMRKAELRVSAEVRERLQAQTLKLVFILYMNVLKLRARNLIGAVLEGLAKFSHLINSELYADLLEVLRELLVTRNTHDTRQSLLCILTAFQLLKGQKAGHEQSTDLGFFIDQLYKTLGEMSLNAQVEHSHHSLQSIHAGKYSSETDIMVKCLEILFIARRSVSKIRLLAFTKRLAECSLQFPERSTLIVLKAMKQIMKQNPDARTLISNEDRVGRGVYNYGAEVPDQSNAEVSTLWEIALLKQHYDPRVQDAAKNIR